MKWEYKALMNATIEELNRLGDDGWELVAVPSTHPTSREFIFKRPKADGPYALQRQIAADMARAGG